MFGGRLANKNENIHLFIIKESYARLKIKQTFSTTSSALTDIFGEEWKCSVPKTNSD
jgi:hypothetical protein